MFYKSLPCGKKVQFFATKSAIFFNTLFLIHLFFRVCGKKKCNMIALILHFYCTLRVLNFSFCFIVLSVFFSAMLHMLHFSQYPPRLLNTVASRVRTRAHVTWGCL